MRFTIGDVRHIITETLTESQAQAIEAYLNEGTIPPADPCRGCEPNVIRSYIARIQKEERLGLWPPAIPAGAGGKLVAVLEGTDVGPSDPEGYTAGTILAISNPDDPDADFSEVFQENPKTTRKKVK